MSIYLKELKMQTTSGFSANKKAISSEDLRITKTKKKLFDTFISMLATTSIENITVNDLCTMAGVRRATFYKHYTDKIDFCSYVLWRNRDEFDKANRAIVPEKYKDDFFVSYAVEYIEFLDANEPIVTNLVRSNLIGVLTHVVLKQHYNEVLKKISEQAADGKKLIATPATVALAVVSSILGIAFSWMQSGRAKPKEEVIEEIALVVRRLVET